MTPVSGKQETKQQNHQKLTKSMKKHNPSGCFPFIPLFGGPLDLGPPVGPADSSSKSLQEASSSETLASDLMLRCKRWMGHGVKHVGKHLVFDIDDDDDEDEENDDDDDDDDVHDSLLILNNLYYEYC